MSFFHYYIKSSRNYWSSSSKVGISVAWETFRGFPLSESLAESVPPRQNTWYVLPHLKGGNISNMRNF